ncbi:MAG: hypothetical protein MJY49_01935 [Bacteroidales bacterium]|nr:hypothetical protein [Bacteroidales bacterium]
MKKSELMFNIGLLLLPIALIVRNETISFCLMIVALLLILAGTVMFIVKLKRGELPLSDFMKISIQDVIAFFASACIWWFASRICGILFLIIAVSLLCGFFIQRKRAMIE